MDEANVPPDRFQAMLYEHCYQYQRATTPVSLCKCSYHPTFESRLTSLVPAVYYAHLAAKRGECHIDMAVAEKIRLTKERLKHPGREDPTHSSEMRLLSEMPKLQKFEPKNQMGYGMWFI